MRGFSLLEVLIALAIFAVVSAAAYRQIGASANAATRLEEKQIAIWVAENTLAQYFTERQWPSVGDDHSESEMAGREWYVVTRVSNTDNEKLRLLEASVYRNRQDNSAVATLYRMIGEH